MRYAMPETTSAANKLVSHLKGFRDHLKPDEQPVMTMPAIWQSAHGQGNQACDVVLTNQRLIGYIYKSFPRTYLFFESIDLPAISQVSLQQRTYEPIFREILVSDNRQQIYIRAPRQKIETLFKSLRAAVDGQTPDIAPANEQSRISTVFERRAIRAEFEQSPLGITILFVGGIIFEIIGVVLWASTSNPTIGLPLCFAGFVAVATAIMSRRSKRVSKR
jgi:hypothetical protein